MATTRSADTRVRPQRSTLRMALVAAAVAFVALLALAQPAAAHDAAASIPATQTVGPPAPPPSPPAPPAQPAPAPVPPQQLAYTGSTTWVLGILGAVFVLSGCALVAASRRRTQAVAPSPSPSPAPATSCDAAPSLERRSTCRRPAPYLNPVLGRAQLQPVLVQRSAHLPCEPRRSRRHAMAWRRPPPPRTARGAPGMHPVVV